MRVNPFICAVIVAAMMPAVALADDPRDPTMRSAAARARDGNLTRRLNLAESARVRERDARDMQGWHAARAGGGYEAGEGDYAVRSRDYERARASYDRDRLRYERDMADWQRAMAACRAGDYSACDY